MHTHPPTHTSILASSYVYACLYLWNSNKRNRNIAENQHASYIWTKQQKKEESQYEPTNILRYKTARFKQYKKIRLCGKYCAFRWAHEPIIFASKRYRQYGRMSNVFPLRTIYAHNKHRNQLQLMSQSLMLSACKWLTF